MKNIADYEKVFVVRIGHGGAGFFAFVQYALNQIRYCEKGDFLPVVNYDGSNRNAFYDEARGPNMWDYYFDPPCGYTFEDIRARLEDPSDPLSRSDITCLTDEEISYLTQRNPDSIYHYTYGYWRANPPQDVRAWYTQQRRMGHSYVAKYVKVKPPILETVERFMSAKDGFWVGAHIRGTDMRYAPKVPLERYFEHFDRILLEHPEARLFIATDQQRYLEELTRTYGDRVLHQDVLRSDSELVPLFKTREADRSRSGDEVLTDALILSRCDFMLKGPSAVGEFAHYFNPELESLDLNFDQTVVGGNDFGHVRFDRSPTWYRQIWNWMRRRYGLATAESQRRRILDRMLGDG